MVFWFRSEYIRPTTTATNIGLVALVFTSLLVKTSASGRVQCKDDCFYGITRNVENEYLIKKNILRNLILYHYNITITSFNLIYDKESMWSFCNDNIDFTCVKQLIDKDYRHPNHLFKTIPANRINETVKKQYEADWYLKYKLINTDRQSNYYKCNELGLKIHCLMYGRSGFDSVADKKTTRAYCDNHDGDLAPLVDYYIAHSLLNDCYGNLELIVRGIFNIIKQDCQNLSININRNSQRQITYYNSKYLNFFRTCKYNTNINDLLTTINCTSNNGHMQSTKTYRSSQLCKWHSTCKHSLECLKALNWTHV